MKQAPLTPKRWRRVEYQRIADLGIFEQDPVQLIGGQLIVAEPKGSEHAAAGPGSSRRAPAVSEACAASW